MAMVLDGVPGECEPTLRKPYPLDNSDAAQLVARSLFLAAPKPVRRAVRGGVTYMAGPRALDPGEPAVLAIGAFDGLHLGHRALLASARANARRLRVPCVAVTFDPDPSELLRGADAERRLLAQDDRVRGLLSLGLDGVVVLSFDRELASLTPQAFITQALMPLCRPVAVHVGTNFRFGTHGAGDVSTLVRLGRDLGFSVKANQLVERDGERVSSTRVRNLLGEGSKLGVANALLGRCHMARGVVEHGRGEGTSFGFPTANVRFSERTCLPAQGVYGGYVTMGASAWPAAINVGAPPTFSGPDDFFLEANLIGFSGNAYGRDVSVTFVEWLRASRPFKSTEELERVVMGNIDWVRTNLGDGEVVVA